MTPSRLPAVTVSVLVWNGERHLDALLTAALNQDYAGRVEVLVIDSGSTDRSLEIVAAHPTVRLHQIPNSQFGHGRTRNLAAQLAKGEIVAYLTHDAVPVGRGWLANLVAPMLDDERIVAVVGKQIPRPASAPVIKYDIRRVFQRLGPDYGTTVVWDTGFFIAEEMRVAACFYSDANSAARRSILTGPVPYRDVAYAEDQFFGRDLFDQGYRKAYAPLAAVEHSNDLGLRESGRRIVDEVLGLRRIGVAIPPMSALTALLKAVKWSLIDVASILADKDYGFLRSLGWLFANPLHQVVKWFSFRRGSRLPV